MKRFWLTAITLGFVLSLGLGALGCKEEGPMEKAGSQLDDQLESAGDAIDDTLADAKKAVEDENEDE